MSFISHADGKQLATWRKKERNAVQAGKARWIFEKPKVVEVRQPTRPPIKRARGPFGEGLGERYPSYRAPVSFDDMAWWETQQAIEEERELQRRFNEYLAMDRLSNGLDPY